MTNKKIGLGMLAVLVFGLALAGCTSAPPSLADTSVQTASIGSFAVGAEVSNFTVLGPVSAKSTLTIDGSTAKRTITGDTLRYGYLSDIKTSLDVGSAYVKTYIVGTGLFKKTVNETIINTPPTYAEIAYANAVYDLIEQAKTKGADALAFVSTKKTQSTQNDGKIYTYTVEVSAIAIKYKGE
jgi:uncharacterized protein YbjQ (UPF0145 family)